MREPHGLLTGTAKSRPSWRYAPSNDLLAVLVQVAAARLSQQGVESIRLQEFLHFLEQRYGILIDRPPDTFKGTEYIAAAHENLRAMQNRLRQMNIFRDLSDDFTIQRLHPPYAEHTTATSKERTSLESQLAAAQSKHEQVNAQYLTMAQTTIPNEMQLFTQSQFGNESVGWLQDDVFIRQWLAKQNSTVQAKIEPTSGQVDHAISDFTANLPKSTSYSKFLSDNSLSNDDARAMMAIKVRRDNMQSYLAAQIVPPLYQVHAREMTLSTLQDANNILKQLKNGGNFAKIAAKSSVETSTNTKGGDLGWLAKGQYAQTIASGTSGIVDNWIFDPARKSNELSPVITENGAYHIVQILQIDPARSVDVTTLSSLQSNALSSWLLSVKAQENLTTIASDQNKLLDPSNIPNTTPAIPASPPATGTPTPGLGS